MPCGMKLALLLLILFPLTSPASDCAPTEENVCSIAMEQLEVVDYRGSLTAGYLHFGDIEQKVFALGEESNVEFLRLETQFHLYNRTVYFEVTGYLQDVTAFKEKISTYRSSEGLR